MEFCFLCWALILFVLYKILDRLIRIPYVGRYDERYILVTGCDTGFGNGIAKRLDQLGCHVFAGCLTEKGETELKKVSSDRLRTISIDISKPESVRKAYDFVKSNLPIGKGLWGVMNNAGILGLFGLPEWLTIDDYKDVMNVNLLGTIDVTMTFLPLVKAARGRIVNTSSMLGRFSIPLLVPYCVSKYGVEAFTDGLRRSLRVFGCQASLIEPGLHKTPITSDESYRKASEAAWNQCSQEVKDKYGEEYIDSYIQETIKELRKSLADPSIVVDAYQHALLGRFPRARYVVGVDAFIVYWPITLMPEWLADFIYDRLGVKKPVPARLKKTG